MGLNERVIDSSVANPSYVTVATLVRQKSIEGVRVQSNNAPLMAEEENINGSNVGFVDGKNIEHSMGEIGHNNLEKNVDGRSPNQSEKDSYDLSNENMHLQSLLKSLLKRRDTMELLKDLEVDGVQQIHVNTQA